MNDYFQEVGRAGDNGQAILYFSPSDISQNLPDIQHDIVDYCHTDMRLHTTICRHMGFKMISHLQDASE